MPVTIRSEGDVTTPTPKTKKVHGNSRTDITPEKFEMFGRLRLSHSQMGQFLGVSAPTLRYHLSKPHLRAAYDKGRAETVVAIRQKQLQVALNGNVTMLLAAGEYYADVGADDDKIASDDEDRRDWDTAIRDRARAAREKLASGDGLS